MKESKNIPIASCIYLVLFILNFISAFIEGYNYILFSNFTSFVICFVIYYVLINMKEMILYLILMPCMFCDMKRNHTFFRMYIFGISIINMAYSTIMVTFIMYFIIR